MNNNILKILSDMTYNVSEISDMQAKIVGYDLSIPELLIAVQLHNKMVDLLHAQDNIIKYVLEQHKGDSND